MGSGRSGVSGRRSVLKVLSFFSSQSEEVIIVVSKVPGNARAQSGTEPPVSTS